VFKRAQHLPVWAPGLTGGGHAATAPIGAISPHFGKAASRESFDHPLFSMPANRATCSALSR